MLSVPVTPLPLAHMLASFDGQTNMALFTDIFARLVDKMSWSIKNKFIDRWELLAVMIVYGERLCEMPVRKSAKSSGNRISQLQSVKCTYISSSSARYFVTNSTLSILTVSADSERPFDLERNTHVNPTICCYTAWCLLLKSSSFDLVFISFPIESF